MAVTLHLIFALFFKMEEEKKDRPICVIFGSSVAAGSGCKNGLGWAKRLEAASKDFMRVLNCSISGMDTTSALSLFDDNVSLFKPYAVIISLSLPNEGFDVFSHKKNLSALVAKIKSIKAVPIICSPYPCDACEHGGHFLRKFLDVCEFLKSMEGIKIIDFWTNVQDKDRPGEKLSDTVFGAFSYIRFEKVVGKRDTRIQEIRFIPLNWDRKKCSNKSIWKC